MSVVPPGANAMITRTGFDGYAPAEGVCAVAVVAKNAATSGETRRTAAFTLRTLP
jgi:hypothetical protein